MRRSGHIRQRSRGSWEIRYSLGADAMTGRYRISTVTVKGTRKDAERELRRLLCALDTGEHVDPTRMTVAQWLSQWLDSMKDALSPKSHERYSEIVANFLKPELGALLIAKLAPAHIQAAYSKWGHAGRRDGKKGGLSPSTRHYIHRVLRASLSRAVEQQVISRNPADVFCKHLPRVERKELNTLSAEQSAALVAALDGSRLQWPVLIALSTGMRRGEILALRWRNFDLERGEVRVTESLEQTKIGGLRFKSTKTNKARVILLPSFMIARARKAKRAQAEELLRVRMRQSGETLVACQADGSPYQPRSFTHAFAREISLIKDLPHICFHDLRHTHATQLLLAGVHPKVAQERLGHSTITTTLDLYSHVTGTMQQDAADRLDAALGHAISGALGSK